MVVDLTHPFSASMPSWPGDPSFVIERRAGIAGEGYLLNRLSLGEHTGTHVGVAAHMRAGGMTVDALPAAALVLPAAVIDVRARCDERYRLSVEDVLEWERANGVIAEGSAVLLCTGWSMRWREPAMYIGSADGSRLAWPGFSLEAARLLGDERGVVALGIDTHGVDAGDDAELSVNRYWLDGARYHLENLCTLEALPAAGAVIVVGAMPIAGGSGAPARVLALVGEEAVITRRA